MKCALRSLGMVALVLLISPVLPARPGHQGGPGPEEQRAEHRADPRGERREERRELKPERRMERREVRRSDRKEDRREDRQKDHRAVPPGHRFHQHEADRHDHDRWDFDRPRHHHPTPRWMGRYWRSNERHYAALVPGDPTRVYILRGGRWVLRPVREARFRADIGEAFALPAPPLPPVPLPRIGLDLKVVLFD